MPASKPYSIAISICAAIALITCGEDELRTPKCVKNTFPLNSQFVPVAETIKLRWESAPGAISYDVFVGEGNTEPVLFAENVSVNELAMEVSSSENAQYTWYARPKNKAGKYSECSSCKTTFGTKALPAFDSEPLPVNVLVLCFDPTTGKNDNIKLHELYHWADPKALAAQYIEDVDYASHGLIQYNIVEWKEINAFPEKVGGFKYTFDTYAGCLSNTSTCRSPDDLDYRKMFNDYGVLDGINNDVYDEVWIFGAPYFGFWESAMAGQGAFYINGGVFADVQAKTFAIMGFSYERGVAEMLHNLCHRTEATMSRLYGGWQAEKLNHSWARFAANQTQSGVAAVGSCHYPPNAKEDYDYCNASQVSSSADDWYNYPYLTGEMNPVDASTWGYNDCQHSYLRWWFHHLPYRSGTGSDGYLNNWWRYIYELE